MYPSVDYLHMENTSMKNLVIVESPSKSKTIAKYLGEGYTVVSSKGHIRDLAIKGKDGLGVDIENDFEPTYVVSKDKTDTVKELRSEAAKAEKVFLATDPDREGEAIDLAHAHRGVQPHRHVYMSHSGSDPGVPPTAEESKLIAKIKKEFRLK